ncbi:hypothetical protein [Lactobacillus kefiranofaciens]|uniref:Uncharacterized protein n=1 Tax=Lactobacillus kefiranofaciens TaxID=267818 RepID=A0AAX3UBV5_9LACO|nr:hypothetical protein [Lactobacillus kefiranofaciens]MDN5638875.1 hypothetical protein [Staphylococcus equorum]AEG41444.1 hypothetical protein WANG_1749 [Lactobacillus kefiranofaciens subsp. kefiranofaciens]KRM19461.1 hypothetical protein FC93_GL002239 [Lactobacillus kefiranofaciens subsp. kefiranofaciens DSM 5016 = JCM 6985]MDH5101435.1 hypothetical protein [Lactobacillus kefiranofaciens]QFQ67167.1 hypothetical protein LKK75_01020 [Lactobacillus kefiranofaciens subsp. kefiranofaciens]
MNNDLFKQKWTKKNKRLTSQDFKYDDVQLLMDLYNSTRWGKDLKTWFPIKSVTTGDENNKTTVKMVTADDYENKLDKYHNACFIKL